MATTPVKGFIHELYTLAVDCSVASIAFVKLPGMDPGADTQVLTGPGARAPPDPGP